MVELDDLVHARYALSLQIAERRRDRQPWRNLREEATALTSEIVAELKRRGRHEHRTSIGVWASLVRDAREDLLLHCVPAGGA